MLFSPRANRPPTEMLNPDTLTALLGKLDDLTRAYADDGRPVPVITPPGLRVGVRRLIEPVLPGHTEDEAFGLNPTDIARRLAAESAGFRRVGLIARIPLRVRP